MNTSIQSRSKHVAIVISALIFVPATTMFYIMGIDDLITHFTVAKLFKVIIVSLFPFVLYFELDMVLNARQTTDRLSLFKVYRNHAVFGVIGAILAAGWLGLLVTTVFATLNGVAGIQRPILSLLGWSAPIILIGVIMAQRASRGQQN